MPTGPQGVTHTGSVVALALVVILNWFLSHLATSWAMPPEVQSAVQTLISIAVTAWLGWLAARGIKVESNGVAPPPPAPAPAAH